MWNKCKNLLKYYIYDIIVDITCKNLHKEEINMSETKLKKSYLDDGRERNFLVDEKGDFKD